MSPRTTSYRSTAAGEKGMLETRACPIANLRFGQRARIAATVPGARGSSGSHAAASAAAAAAMMIVVDSSRWITRRRGWRPARRRAGKRRGDETRGCQLADLHNMISSRFVSFAPILNDDAYRSLSDAKERRDTRRKKKRTGVSDSEDIWKSRDALPVSARGGLKNLTDASPTIETIRTDTRPAVHWSPG